MGGESRFFRMCAQYVSENLFSSIKAQQMADALGYTRAYLCTRFKQEAGISLSRYIQQEKIAEARRLLQFTDQGLGEIAALLDFSSQSHFQTVFRKEPDVAVELMLEIHTKGAAIVGIYTLDIALSKIRTTERYAAEGGFPLRLTTEKD